MSAFRIMRRVSAPGGYLETFAGRQAGTDRPVLLKHLTQLPPSIDRLMETVRTLRGPRLPAALEVGTNADGLWIVTEAAEGESLRWMMSTLARAAGFIAPNEGLAVVARVASALDLLHRQHLAHGDVCPTTIFVTNRGEVQLHDAGIASALSPHADFGPWRSEMNSLAPEQVTGPATPESDVFRLGLVLYELAVGRPLWSGPSPAHLCHAATTWTGLTREKVKQVPEPWLTLLGTMLAVDPHARPSMEEVLAVLEQAVTQNQWATSDDDIARLFARASPGRLSPFTADPTAPPHELTLTSLTPPGGSPAVTPPPGAVVARITTKKMTREMLAVVVRTAEAAAAEAKPPDESLEVRMVRLLLERGRVTRAQVAAAQEAAEALGGSMGTFLINDGVLDEDALVAVIAELTRTPSITTRKLAEAAPSHEALALVPLALSVSAHAVPLGLKGGSQLMVAMSDPMDAKALEQLKAAIGTRSLIAFRAGERALTEARTRLYAEAAVVPSAMPRHDPLALIEGPPTAVLPALGSELPSKVIDSLIGLLGQRGVHAQQLVSLSIGLARRMGLSINDVALAGLAARAMVASALGCGRAPWEVPKLAEVQERLGFGTEADEFVDALQNFPTRMPERPVIKAVVLAFCFAAHAGEPRPSGSRLGGALNSFRSRYQPAQPLFECLGAELSGS